MDLILRKRMHIIYVQYENSKLRYINVRESNEFRKLCVQKEPEFKINVRIHSYGYCVLLKFDSCWVRI